MLIVNLLHFDAVALGYLWEHRVFSAFSLPLSPCLLQKGEVHGNSLQELLVQKNGVQTQLWKSIPIVLSGIWKFGVRF